MKILLVCAAGMSTSLMVSSMKDSLEENEKDWIIEAKSAEVFEDVYANYDVILLAPQIRYKKTKFEKIANESSIPVGLIEPADYGRNNGENVLNQAKEIYKNK